MTGVSDSSRLKTKIKAEAAKLGFCFCGFTDVGIPADFPRYEHWLKAGSYGTMTWMARPDHIAKRAALCSLLPEAKTVCILGVPMPLIEPEAEYTVASYAHYADYHDSIRELAEKLIAAVDLCAPYRICVDAEPILERSLAVQAGLGWIGKSSMFISPQSGSAVFLCEILLGIALEPDPPYTKDGCGTCTRCVDACPGRCIDPETRTIRADHCAAYLTIEHKGEFTAEQSAIVGTRLFGCDECLRACPWNSRASVQTPLPPASVIPTPTDTSLSESEYKQKYQGTPAQRLKAKGLKRNAAAVEKNRGLSE